MSLNQEQGCRGSALGSGEQMGRGAFFFQVFLVSQVFLVFYLIPLHPYFGERIYVEILAEIAMFGYWNRHVEFDCCL